MLIVSHYRCNLKGMTYIMNISAFQDLDTFTKIAEISTIALKTRVDDIIGFLSQ